MASPRPDARVDADLADADALGVAATPTVFMNGRRLLSGGTDLRNLSRITRRYLLNPDASVGRNGKASSPRE
jgi:predicted DsbA family dithiol-disulfide isomerase